MKKTLNPKKQKECIDTTHDIQIDYCGYCVTCAKKPKAEEKCKCHCHCTDCGRNADLKHIFKNCNHCQPKAKTGWESRIRNKYQASYKEAEGLLPKEVTDWLIKDIAKELERQRGEIIEFFDIELEAWMQVHDEQNRSFDTQSLVKHMKKALKTL